MEIFDCLLGFFVFLTIDKKSEKQHHLEQENQDLKNVSYTNLNSILNELTYDEEWLYSQVVSENPTKLYQIKEKIRMNQKIKDSIDPIVLE